MLDVPSSARGKSAYDVAHEATMEAGRLLVRGYGEQKQISFKGRGNVVTNLDLEVEARVIDLLLQEYPDFGILSEEREAIPGKGEYTWILDPLDGSRNFASGNPFFSVNLGLVRGKEVVLGLTYDPLREELFHAIKGQGAFLNESPLSISKQDSVQASVLALDMGYSEELARKACEMLIFLWPGMQSTRIMGSAALGLAYAATGRVDLYFHHFLAPWDLVSGILLVQEAGGVITQGNGGPVSPWSRSVIASNKAIHADFLRRTEGCEWRKAVSEEEA